MNIEKIIIKNFRCFGETPVEIDFDEKITFFVGNNGTGKTTIFDALKKIFGKTREDRSISKNDFHLNYGETLDSLENKEMFIEIVFSFPECSLEEGKTETLAAFETAMFVDENKNFKARMRLEAKWTQDEFDDDVETKLYWIVTNENIGFGEDFLNKYTVSNYDRKLIDYHYIPAFRNSHYILKDNVQTFINLIIKYVDLEKEKAISQERNKKEEIEKLNTLLQNEIKEVEAIKNIKNILDEKWKDVYDKSLQYYSNTQFEVTPNDIKELLRSLTIKLSPNEQAESCDIEKLSDGQVSLLYITLALTLFEIEQMHFKNAISGLTLYDKIPSIFTIFVIEEPENHLSPFYLSKIFNLLDKTICKNENIIGLVSSHSPNVMRRVANLNQVRYLLNSHTEDGCSKVLNLKLPDAKDEDVYKYINQAILAHPELYFSKLVILGEGDSEEIVIPQIATKLGVDLDPSFVSFVKLGGRHVNHMWKLLKSLNIPFLTLLDFDLGRYQGGIERLAYIIDELNNIGIEFNYPNNLTRQDLCEDKLTIDDVALILENLENIGVYYSTPLDLDMAMIRAFPELYKDNANDAELDDLKAAIFGKNRNMDLYVKYNCELSNDLLKKYRYLFKTKSKVASHYLSIEKIIELNDDEFNEKCPQRLKSLINKAKQILANGVNYES
ncbi:MAG: DUF2813 domain-containing protein [Cyanobacteria bacterium SIG28]|nr:DUF2813 domain-containing protein [Cyanobacteria bacterium SIG28]